MFSIFILLSSFPFLLSTPPYIAGSIQLPSETISRTLYSSKILCFPFPSFDLLFISRIKVSKTGEILLYSPSDSVLIMEIVTKTHFSSGKVLISLGGPQSFGDDTFFNIFHNPLIFQENIAKFLDFYELDGLDIDWAFNPDPSLVKNIAENFKNSEKTKKKLLSIQQKGGGAILPQEILKKYDFLNIVNFMYNEKVAEDLVMMAGSRFFMVVPSDKKIVAINFQAYGEKEYEDLEVTKKVRESLEGWDVRAVAGVMAWDVLYDSGAKNGECRWEGVQAMVEIVKGKKGEKVNFYLDSQFRLKSWS